MNMDSGNFVVSIADLETEAGVVAAAVQMAHATCTGGLYALVQHTPKEMRQVLFERFFCALTGAMCAEIGPDKAKETLDAVKLALAAVQAERRQQH